jgi:hypothetical protein
MTSGNSATGPTKIATFDSSKRFCLSLAQHVKWKYPARLSLASWKAAVGADAPNPSTVSVEEIATKYLKPNVAAQARLAALLEYSPSRWLLEQEMLACGVWPVKNPNGDGFLEDNVYKAALDGNLNGVCLSGGGIRSATFNLGVLQALAAQGKLANINYLSSVSGGGYIHQFLASWISCENLAQVEEQLIPLPGKSGRTAWPEPIRWLRRYSNYLTPRKGLLTADTWVAASIWLRNTILNQIVLFATLLFVLLIPHMPLLHLNPHWAGFYFDETAMAPASSRSTYIAAIVAAALFLFAAVFLYWGLRESRHPKDRNDPTVGAEDACVEPPLDKAAAAKKRLGYSGRRVFSLVLFPTFLGFFVVAPFLYRSSFPPLVPKTGAPFAATSIPALVHQLHTLAGESKPPPTFRQNAGVLLHDYRSLRFWFPWDSDLQYVLMALLFGQALFVVALAAAIPKGSRRLFPVLAAATVAIVTALVLVHVARLILLFAGLAFPYETLIGFAITFVPILLQCVLFISMDLAIGTIGRCMRDSSREWLARVRSLSFLSGFAWIAVVGCSLLGSSIVSFAFHFKVGALLSGVSAWMLTTVASLLAGKGSKTKGHAESQSSTDRVLELLVMIGPPVFILGLMLLLSWGVHLGIMALGLIGIGSYLVAAGVIGIIALFFSWRVDINAFSLHAFYRDRIARCYAGASNPDRRPDTFTGLASSDGRLRLADLLPARFGNADPSLWLDSKRPPSYQGPFPIFLATLNLSFGADLATQERKAAAFAFTPLFCGYDVGWTEGSKPSIQFNGFTPTNNFVDPGAGPHVSTAVSASGAALNPNQGFHTSTAMAFLLTLFNARLGWWLPNPRNLRTDFMSRLSGATPVLGLPYLLRDLFGMVSDDAPFVSVSDGGQFENMGLYELVRRRCRNIIICDAEEDADFTFEGLGMAIRKCRIDFGVEIVLELDKVVPGKKGVSEFAHATGKIVYPAETLSGATIGEEVVGEVLYLKSTLTGNEPSDIRNYKREHPVFPSDTTLNQWFTESQFESYRRLGQFVAEDQDVGAWLKANFN